MAKYPSSRRILDAVIGQCLAELRWRSRVSTKSISPPFYHCLARPIAAAGRHCRVLDTLLPSNPTVGVNDAAYGQSHHLTKAFPTRIAPREVAILAIPCVRLQVIVSTTTQFVIERRGVMTREYPKHMESYLTDGDVAALLGISVTSLRNKVSAGVPLPPYIRPSGCRKRLWPCRQVQDWLTGYLIGAGEQRPGSGERPSRRQRRSRSYR